MNTLDLPQRFEFSFSNDSDGQPIWKTNHDPATQTIVIQYSSGIMKKRREIDSLVSSLACDLHNIAARIHPYED